jgi:hypothetical protein
MQNEVQQVLRDPRAHLLVKVAAVALLGAVVVSDVAQRYQKRRGS